ncbi:MAG: DUF87 domain-containing protein [Akkermansiaceae bacterium]|nr:DUF87 domain-containing protein [Akkermansiaceae bacterium]
MSITPADYEKLGQFYLGKEYDPATRAVTDDLVLYDSKDLVTHGVVLGMTGSGKTGLCLALLEEAAMDNIPAIIIDPKGDISNLLLTFPELDAASFRPWINEDDAAKKGLSPDDFAAKTAEGWKKGLADWGQEPDRIRQFQEKVDINIFTPGSKAGIPVSILSSLEVPPDEILEDGELFSERVESTVSSLLSLVGVNADTAQSPEAVLLAAIFQNAWQKGQGITLEKLIGSIQKPAFDKIGVIDLASFFPEKKRQDLALKFNTLLASPGFASWLEGVPLDISDMLKTRAGKPRISIFSIAHLGDAERMFFVSLLLNQTLGWMRTQTGTTSLRALLYMDEIFGYLPPSANPPSKRPMMTLLKQARAFGLGCLLATQNPVDLDYKALSNIGTWFLGRLQTERDKLRVLDGLEGAAGSQNAQFDRKQMETLISGLGNRVFLMNNVHDDAPTLFHVRWVMSYLTGPLARAQIKSLMDPKRGEFAGIGGPSGKSSSAPDDGGMPGMPGLTPSAPEKTGGARPIVGAGVKEIFAPLTGPAEETTYAPHLLRTATVHFSSTRMGVEGSRTVRFVNPILPDKIDLAVNLPPPLKLDTGNSQPADGAGFRELPGYAMNAANYKQVEKTFAEELYRTQRAEVFSCPALKAFSNIGETEGDFRARLHLQAREARDTAVQKLRDAAAKRIATLEGQLRTAEGQLDRQKAESNAAKLNAGVSVLGGILGAVLGKKGRGTGLGSITRGSSAISKGASAYKQMQDVSAAEAKVEGVESQIEAVQKDLEAQAAQIASQYDTNNLSLETESLKPTKTDVKVELVALLWVPVLGG